MPVNLALAPVRRGWLPAMAALSAAVFLMKWKGALHAIDLGIAWNHRKQRHPHLAPPFPMLIELCSEMIVRDSSTVKKVLPYLPQHIFYPIMKAAITKGHDRSMEVLLPAWPSPVFVLNNIWPDLYNTLTILYNSTAHNANTRQGITITKSLINAFLNLIKTDCPTKLRILDLREFPTGDAMIYRLAEEIISFHEKQQQFPENEEENPAGYSSPSFEVLLDCVVREDETFQELCTALKISQKPGAHLRMRIFKIDASCRGVSQISLLLDYLQANDLVGLCIQYNSLSSEGLIKLAPKLKCLQSLTALDMSCNNLNLTQSSSACAVLAEVLGELKNLRRLDLSNNRLSNCVSQVLGHTHHHKLEYLKLSACVLTRSDLSYLSSSHNIHSISELDLSENFVLSQQVDLLANLLNSLSPILQVLELEDCNFNNHHLGFLINTFMNLSELQYMNFARNCLSSESLFTHIARLGSLPQLQCLRLSYSEDCYLEVSDSEMYDQRKMRLRAELEKQMAAFRSILSDPLPSVHLVWTECLDF